MKKDNFYSAPAIILSIIIFAGAFSFSDDTEIPGYLEITKTLGFVAAALFISGFLYAFFVWYKNINK